MWELFYPVQKSHTNHCSIAYSPIILHKVDQCYVCIFIVVFLFLPADSGLCKIQKYINQNILFNFVKAN